jgi:RNA polymerase sigma factor (sigma-70 family)
MQAKSDTQLIREYAKEGNEGAFTEIVVRHTNLVYSAALRHLNSPELAAEISQRVFVGLARSAGSITGKLAQDASLGGWLCRSARNVSLAFRRDELRRHSRERQAMENLDTAPDAAPDWDQLRPILDEAMAELSEPDYDALVLRFFKNQDLRLVGLALGVSDDAAQKRVSRALDKLRAALSQRGLASSAAALSAALSASAVQNAPAGLALSIANAAVSGAAALNAPAAITATKALAMTTLQKSMLAVVLAVVGGAGIHQTYEASSLRNRLQRLQRQDTDLVQQLKAERDEATNRLALVAAENARLNRDHSNAELLRLRGDLARLRNVVDERSNDPMASISKQVARRINEIMNWIERTPGESIPELRLLSAQDLLGYATQFPDIKEERDLRFGASRLRLSAKTRFCSTLGYALQDFLLAHDGELPPDISELKPFCRSQADDDMLQRYELLHSGNIRDYPQTEPFIAEKDAPRTGQYDAGFKINVFGYSYESFNITTGESGTGDLHGLPTERLKSLRELPSPAADRLRRQYPQ